MSSRKPSRRRVGPDMPDRLSLRFPTLRAISLTKLSDLDHNETVAQKYSVT